MNTTDPATTTGSAAVGARAERPVRPGSEAFLTPQDMEDLRRLEDLFTDDQGWDLPKERMQRLAELGVIRRTNRDRYALTAFGCWCVGEWRGLPLKTWQEQCDQAKREHLARVGA
jgi:hypothetical protein